MVLKNFWRLILWNLPLINFSWISCAVSGVFRRRKKIKAEIIFRQVKVRGFFTDWYILSLFVWFFGSCKTKYFWSKMKLNCAFYHQIIWRIKPIIELNNEILFWTLKFNSFKFTEKEIILRFGKRKKAFFKGAEHRNIGTLGCDIMVRCTLPASNWLFCYKYLAAVPLLGMESQCFYYNK